MDHLKEIAETLASARIAFTIHYVGDSAYVVTVSETLNNEQLAKVVTLGGSMGPDSKVYILGNLS
jgi:hypothetical protein